MVLAAAVIPPGPWPFRLVVDHVRDGDTIAGTLVAERDMGLGVWSQIMLTKWAVRFYGINAAEVGTEAGDAAKLYLQKMVSGIAELRVDSYSFDKYRQRVDGVPYLPDGTNLCDAMVEAGLATRL